MSRVYRPESWKNRVFFFSFFSRGEVFVDLVLDNRIDLAPLAPLAPLRSTDMDSLLSALRSVCIVHSFGLRQYFVNEGTFKARVLAADEEFPIPEDIDISDIEVPVGTGYTRLRWLARSPL